MTFRKGDIVRHRNLNLAIPNKLIVTRTEIRSSNGETMVWVAETSTPDKDYCWDRPERWEIVSPVDYPFRWAEQ